MVVALLTTLVVGDCIIDDMGGDGSRVVVDIGGGRLIVVVVEGDCNGSVFFLSNLQLDYILSYHT